jgi:micrococcal nuclease|tara:strand:+ start:1109 stop:1537 length:429 start_codon:yes stop_codon:yes gene_type:complete
VYEYKCEVTRVVDGDTVDCVLDLGFSILHKCRVRLYGIDTPESRTRDLDEKARGKLAAKFLQDSIDSGKDIVLRSELKDSKGKYGRVLGSIVVDDLDINKAMIANNLAVKYFGQSKSDVEAEHMINKDILIAEGAYEPISDI